MEAHSGSTARASFDRMRSPDIEGTAFHARKATTAMRLCPSAASIVFDEEFQPRGRREMSHEADLRGVSMLQRVVDRLLHASQQV